MKKILVKTRSFLSRLRNNGFFLASAGFLFFLIFAAVLMFSIESGQQSSKFSDFFQSLWFTVVTVTTVGYGDMSPFSTLGKLAAVAIMFMGIGYSGILTGNITSWLVEKNRKKALGLVPLKNKQNHMVIFGWRPDMPLLLINILKLHQQSSKYLVLVNNVDINKINNLRQYPALQDLYYFRGNYTNTEVLHNICIESAEKALILADEESGKSADEIDFKTVQAAKAVERLNPKIFTIAEIIQPEFGSSLTRANVEETITNRYTCRALTSNLALLSGLHSIIRILFNNKSGLLQILDLPDKYIGKTFVELTQDYNDILVIGMLENSGDLAWLKQEKMHDIQKSVSIQLAIQKLMEIKNMRSNFPMINPTPNYTIKENSSLIYIQTNPESINYWYQKRIKENEGKGFSFDQEFLASKLTEITPKYKHHQHLSKQLQELEIELYEYNDEVCGVFYKNNRYLFESLQLDEAIINLINILYENKSPLLLENQKKLSKLQTAEHEALDAMLVDYKHNKRQAPYKKTRTDSILLICGWKTHLPDMINFMLKHHNSRETEWDQIVIVADITPDAVNTFNDQFKEDSRVKLVRGDFVNRSVLLKAGIKKANKIMILAEIDSKRSYHEIDARSVLTAMSINELNKRAYKIVEILNQKYEETLKHSDIEEIIPLDEIYQIMLSNGAHGLGVTHVVDTIINLEDRLFHLNPIASNYINKPFSELLEGTKELDKMIIGILEETGNTYVRKAEVIRRAQLEPKITDSVIDLKRVKDISANQVVLSPEADYLIKPYSKLISLASSDKKGWRVYIERHN
ncbi:MAG: potassium channel protein [Deltaproteobacteria bacterium]|nr:potassium channel protein [Deltaproteobacteria bacterium]